MAGDRRRPWRQRASEDTLTAEGSARPKVGVACLVTRDGRLLLLRRQRSHGAGSWSPPGGHLDYGESIDACAIRETMEETGLQVANLRFVAVTNDIFETEGRHYVTVWMRGDVGAGEPSVQDPAEVAEVGWFDPDRLPAPLFLSLANLVAGRSLPSRASTSVPPEHEGQP